MAGVMRGLRRARRSVPRRAPTSRRSHGHRRRRRPRRRRRARRVPGPVAGPPARRSQPRSPRVHPHGRPRRERLDRERDPATCVRRRPEEPRGGLRPHRRRSDVEAKARSLPVRLAGSSTRSRTGLTACSWTIPRTCGPSARPSSCFYGTALRSEAGQECPPAGRRRVPRRPPPRAVRQSLRGTRAEVELSRRQWSGTEDGPAPLFASLYAGVGCARWTVTSCSCHRPQPASSTSSAPGMTKNHVNRLKFGRLFTDL